MIVSSLHTYGTQPCSLEPFAMVIMRLTSHPYQRGGATAGDRAFTHTPPGAALHVGC